MNFNQKPGVYIVETDKLLYNFHDTKNFRTKLFKATEPFYIILPEDKKMIDAKYFSECKNLVGIYGKNVEHLEKEAFFNCFNLEEINFPNLKFIDESVFGCCYKVEEKYTNKEGLLIIDNALVDVFYYKNEKLIIPDNIDTIAFDVFLGNNCIKEVEFPFRFGILKLYPSSKLDKVILPIDFKKLEDYASCFGVEVIYKGQPEKLEELIKADKIYAANSQPFKCIKNKPYSIEDFKDTHRSLEDVELVLNKKLTLNELIYLNHSMKEANDYFKQKEEER